jgi:RimJ/RimL family protein N-acetyltransferase
MGLGTEAKMLWLKYAFFNLNLRQVYSSAIAFNTRSQKYSKKCGYKEIGRIPNHQYIDGLYHDIVTLMVTREDWEPLWREFEIKMEGETDVEGEK